ncbi:MAG: hypothetical protein IPJ65_43115 [Archangiaceae bacterium]|nr:hypothetical protein [Archangiaceae bacterium]
MIALNVGFRFPALLNSGAVHSDAAIVGLQAMHFLKGETSRFLWGADYQGSFDVWVVAAFFSVFGVSPLVLMLAPMFGHLLMVCAVFALLVRLLGNRVAAFVACLPLTFTPQAINGVVLYPPRQWGITFVICGAVLIAWPSVSRAPLRIAVGVALAIASIYCDMFCLLWMPAIGVLAVLACFDQPRDLKPVALRFVGALAGSAFGTWAVRALRQSAEPKQHEFQLGLNMVEHNWPLMRDTCFPFLFGAKVWVPGSGIVPELWVPAAPVRALQAFGALTLVLLAVASVVLMFTRRVPWEVKRLVVFGAAATGTAAVGFLISTYPGDMWSTRYLAPTLWGMPFTLGALAYLLRPRGFAVLMVPYLVVAAIGGWVNFGPYVDGPMPRLSPRGAAADEAELAAFLKSRNIEHGHAQYWLAHRLTFLWQEHPAIAAFEWDRYPPYRLEAERARRKAFIFHPSEPRASPQVYWNALQQAPGRKEIVQVAGFTVILYEEQP